MPAAHLSLMRALLVIVVQPDIQIALQLLNREMYFAAECDLVKLLQNSFMEAFTDVICLRVVHFRIRMLRSR